VKQVAQKITAQWQPIPVVSQQRINAMICNAVKVYQTEVLELWYTLLPIGYFVCIKYIESISSISHFDHLCVENVCTNVVCYQSKPLCAVQLEQNIYSKQLNRQDIYQKTNAT
jgi:hypothetical protein